MLIMGNLKIYCGVGVSSTFLAVMWCSYQFFAVLRYSEPPNAPLRKGQRRAMAEISHSQNKWRSNFCLW